ncbi:MAG TPA: phosphatidate cytidylyltransferase [Actinocatenispora sp.]
MASIGPYPSFEPQPRAGGRHRAPDPSEGGPAARPPHPGAPGVPAEPRWDETVEQALPPLRQDPPTEPTRYAGPPVPPPAPVPPAPLTGPAPLPEPAPLPVPDPPAGDEAPASGKPRAGRNLPAAIGVGVGLGAVVLASLFIWRPAFLVVVAVGVVAGTWETVRAFGRAEVQEKRTRPPLVPLLVGALAMQGLAWFGGLEALTVGLVFTLTAVLIWRLADGPPGFRRDVTAAALIAAYVPFLGGFATLLARPDDGAARIVVVLAMVVLSDTGGYAVGVFLGKHKMAPRISPGKSWEGFAGSVLTTAIGGAVLLLLIFHVPLWYGAAVGVAVSLASVLGDLAESMIKRDLGIKDMGHLLPGHGGVMDRLDSILFAVPVSFALLSVLAPAAG